MCTCLDSVLNAAFVIVQQYCQGVAMEQSTKPRLREQVRTVIGATRIT